MAIFSQPRIPIENKGNQFSVQWFGKATNWIQSSINRMDNYAAMKSDLEKLATDVENGMDPDAAKKKFAEIKDLYQPMLTRFGEILQPNLREGRSTLRDYVFWVPQGLMRDIVTFENNVITLRIRITQLTEKKELSPAEQTELEQDRSSLEDAVDRVSAAIAAYDVFSFLYPEVFDKNTNDPKVKKIQDLLQTYELHLHFDTYRKNYADSIRKVLEDLDFLVALVGSAVEVESKRDPK